MRGILWTLFIIVAAFRGRDKGGSQEHGISVKKRSGPGKRKLSRGGVKKPDEAALKGEPKSREQTRFEKTDLEANGQSDAPRSMSAADLGREGYHADETRHPLGFAIRNARNALQSEMPAVAKARASRIGQEALDPLIPFSHVYHPSQERLRYRFYYVSTGGLAVSLIPLIFMQIGKRRREFLKARNEERVEKLIAHAESRRTRTTSECKEKGIMWPSEIEGDIVSCIRSDQDTYSSEGILLSYDSRKFSLFRAIHCVDNVFFDTSLNNRVLIHIGIGMISALLELLFLKRASGDMKSVEWDLDEINHMQKEASSVLNITNWSLGMFLGLFVSFMVSRHTNQWGNMAMGSLWAGCVNWNMYIAGLMPEEDHELFKKTICRWTLCVWEDTFDCCSLSAEDYLEGKGLELLKRRGLLLEDEVSFLLSKKTSDNRLAGAENTYAQLIITWMLSAANRLRISETITPPMQVKLFDLAQMMRSGVGSAASWPVMQYPYLPLNYLNAVVNMVTILNALKSGLSLGVGVLEWNGVSESFDSGTIFPALSLLIVPYFFHGALMVGMLLDNPLYPGYQNNIHSYPRHTWYSSMRANLEAYYRAGAQQLNEDSMFYSVLAKDSKTAK